MEYWLIGTSSVLCLLIGTGVNAGLTQRILNNYGIGGDASLDGTPETEVGGEELFRYRRDTNDTVPTSGDDGSSQSAVEAFFADRHNLAMYVVLPAIIFVYGGCASIYCCYKGRRFLRKRIIRYQNEKRKKALHDSNWTPANNEVESSKSVPDLRIDDEHNNIKRPATAFPTVCANVEIQDMEQDPPEVPEKKPMAEMVPVVQVKRKEPPKKARPVMVDVKPVVSENTDTTSDDNDSKKRMMLSVEDIAEIMKYYNHKKHMPNVIPEEQENNKQIIRKIRMKKIFST